MTYGEIISNTFNPHFELVFFLLSKIVSQFTMNFRVVMIVVALISLTPVFILYFYNAKRNAYLSIVIFLSLGLFSIYFSAFRQVMAMAFAVPAYYFTKNRKLVLFLLMVFLAYFAHHSAIVMFLMYPVFHLNLRINSSLLILIPIIALVYYFRVPVFSWLTSFLSDFRTNTIKETGAILVFLLLLGFLIFCYVIPDNSSFDEETLGIRNLLLLATILQIFAGINSVAMRMNYYYLLFVPLVIPRVLNNASLKNRYAAQISYIVMLGFFTFWYIFRTYTAGDTLHVYPYFPAWAI